MFLNRSDLSVAEREEYTAAVKCLQAASPKSPQQLVPGARSRFDDFLATHINQTDSIHNTVSSDHPVQEVTHNV